MITSLNDEIYAPAKTERICLGIDLGTTNTLAAYYDGDTLHLIPFGESNLFPSVVSKKSNENVFLAGWEALAQKDNIHSFKRFMPFPNQILYAQKKAPELSAIILKAIKERAETELGKPCTQAVITVPAYFDEIARQATKDAAALAGIAVIRLINEPTAAALAYGLEEKKEGNFLVYDLGGGTFDVSILKLCKGFFQVLATAGDTYLGGDDIDQAILNFWDNPSATPGEARQAKEHLSVHQNYENLEKGCTLNLQNLETLAKPLIDRTLELCKLALKDARLGAKDLDGIILVGGSTRMPLVHQAVEAFFNKHPLQTFNPDEVVAMGAAKHAHALTHGSDTVLVDVCPLSLGIETYGGIFEKIIHRNTPLPVAMAQDFTTQEPGQTAMKISVYQGEREYVKDCLPLGEFTLSGIPPMDAGAARIRITFTLDADSMLSVSAQEQITGANQTKHVKPAQGLSGEELKAMVLDSYAHGQEDLNLRLIQEARQEARQIIYFVEKALAEDGDLILDFEKNVLKTAVKSLQSLLNGKDREALITATKELSNLSQPFAQKRIERSIAQRLTGTHI